MLRLLGVRAATCSTAGLAVLVALVFVVGTSIDPAPTDAARSHEGCHPDTVACPTILIVAPRGETDVDGSTTVAGLATGGVKLVSVDVKVGHAHFEAAELTIGPNIAAWHYRLDPAGLPDGHLTVVARATDIHDRIAEDTVTVRVTKQPNPVPDPGAQPDVQPQPAPHLEAEHQRQPDSSPEPSITCHGIAVEVGHDLPTVIEAHPDGTEFCLAAGVHRLNEPLRPKTGQTLLGVPGAVLNGSKVVTDWVRDGRFWYASGQTQRFEPSTDPRCVDDVDTCQYREAVFLDHDWLLQVSSLDQLSSGRFFFDYHRDRIYLAEDPRGRLVETTVTDWAIRPGGDNVTIRGLIIEKFANPQQRGAVDMLRPDGTTAAGWVIEGNEIRLNHGAAIWSYTDAVVRDNHIHHQGQIGLVGAGADVLIERNRIHHNNLARFDPGWEAGATKWARTTRLVVRGNHVHDNNGHGLWTDIDNVDTLYEYNLVERNGRSGIYHEISYDAVIRNNTVRGNGHDRARWASGAGIRVANSSNVEVYGNHVEDNGRGIVLSQQDRGRGERGAWETRNVHVHDNTVTMTTGFTGLVQDTGNNAVFTKWNNRFEGNTYFLDKVTARRFSWMNQRTDMSGWRNSGQDTGGQFIAK